MGSEEHQWATTFEHLGREPAQACQKEMLDLEKFELPFCPGWAPLGPLESFWGPSYLIQGPSDPARAPQRLFGTSLILGPLRANLVNNFCLKFQKCHKYTYFRPMTYAIVEDIQNASYEPLLIYCSPQPVKFI